MKVVGENEVLFQMQSSTGPAGKNGKDGKDGAPGPAGPKGDDYNLTQADIEVIAEMAAKKVEVPDSEGGGGASIDDSAPASNKTYSSKKIDGLMEKVNQKDAQ